jgi:hypothetical protein
MAQNESLERTRGVWGQRTLLNAKENVGEKNLGRDNENPLRWVVAAKKL